MEINRPKRRKLMGEINVVPLIDVMLVLLVVFMVTAPLITQGIKVDLPKADAQPAPEEDLTLVVSIDAAGKYFITLGKVSEDNPPSVPLEQIGDNVAKILNQNPGVPVFVEADAGINYGLVMNLLSTLEKAGAQGVRLVTQPPDTAR